jgi:predicted nucleotidyltransferase
MDISSLLKSLNAQRVQYVIIGATAFPTHGYARATADIDILIKPMPENARRAIAALAQVGYDVGDLSTAEVLQKKILFRQYILATDIHPSAVGVTFDTVWRNRVKDTIEGVPVFVASLDDLIKMKRAANRAKDREDLKVLRELKRRKRARK